VLDETLPEPEVARDLRARRPRDDMGAHLRELPLREVRMLRVQRMSDCKLEDAVAEELEPLVRVVAIASPRGVGEDRLRQLRRERGYQLGKVRIRGYWCEVT
jgi:hypothetical protein